MIRMSCASWRDRLRRFSRCWYGLLVGGAICAPVPSLAAQVTYTVFPVTSSPVATPTAQPTGLDTPVALDVRDSTIAYVVGALVRQSHLRLIFNDKDPAFAQRISVHVARTTNLLGALGTVLRGTRLQPQLLSDGETIVIRDRAGTTPLPRAAFAGGIVAGRVIDSASGQGLGGATVKVEGTKLSMLTSDSGNFTLKDVPSGGQVLSVKLFGYKPAERMVTVVDSERTIVRVALVAVPTVLSGVVTTATGLQRKVEVGNDITTLNVDSVMRVAPVTSVTDLLETRVPGLTVLHSSGVPGDPSRIRLRGVSTLNGNNDPIVIVNGIRVYASQSDARNSNLADPQRVDATVSRGTMTPGGNPYNSTHGYSAQSPLDQIDPNNIETIEVLKGPSASALYGSDAASGVIVITTKHGRAGPTHWTSTLGVGVNSQPGSWPVNYYRFGFDPFPFASALLTCAWNSLTCQTDSLVAFQALNDPRYTVFGEGHNQTASLGVSGGSPTLTYSLTGSGAGDVGDLHLPTIEKQRYEATYGPIPGYLVHPDNLTSWGVSGQLTAQPTPAVQVTLMSSLFNTAQQQGSLQGAILQLEGEYVSPALLAGTPLIQYDVQRATDQQLASNNALNINWRPVAWLPLNVTGGINTIQRTDETLIPYGINPCGPLAYNPLGCGDTTGSYGLGRGTSQDKTLTVGTTGIPLKLVTLAVGANLTQESTADVTATTQQLAPGVTVPTTFLTTDCGGTNQPGCATFSQATTAWSTYGWYIEPRLNVASKFFVAPGFRLDGGSASGANAGLTAFPKIDLSFIAIDQSHPRGILTLLRPRVAFGFAGTQPGPAEKLRLFNVNCANGVGGAVQGCENGAYLVSLNDTTVVPAASLTTLGNTQLRPERSRELEGGFDAELWHGRFSVTYTQYNKTRFDAIVGVGVAPSVFGEGQNIEENVGVVRNTGTEVTMNATLLQNRMVTWTVNANVSNNNNLVVRLNPGVSTIILPNNERIEAGYPLFAQFVTPILGFADANHNGIIETSEIRYGDTAVYVGQQEPKYQFNFGTGGAVWNGRLSVNATFAYTNGLTQVNAGAIESNAIQNLANTPGTSLATQAAVVAASAGVSPIGFVQTVNTFRFNNFSINYSLPKTIAHWFRVPYATLALQGSNLMLQTNYHGKDPDVNAFSTVSGGDETIDLGQLPEPRTWWLKLSLGN